eukprot:3638999-Amphidinium_carterae.1
MLCLTEDVVWVIGRNDCCCDVVPVWCQRRDPQWLKSGQTALALRLGFAFGSAWFASLRRQLHIHCRLPIYCIAMMRGSS